MITIYIYTAKIISVSRTCYDRHDIFKRNFSETIHKGGGFFKFNGTKEEFIRKVVNSSFSCHLLSSSVLSFFAKKLIIRPATGT